MPAAAGLRKQGAGKGATTAFLIATPETGVDSMAITYALLDPLMTVLRPLAAIATAIAAGIMVNFGDKEAEQAEPEPEPALKPLDISGCPSGCCSSQKPAKPSLVSRLGGAIRYAVDDLARDIGPWLLAGLLIAGAISALIPEGFIERHLHGGLASMLVMLAAGLPIYVCATASTPIAAALALKGLSPGAALVFLLAGPATNAASVTVMAKMLGKRAAAISLAAIAVVSVGLGLLVNFLYAELGLSVADWARGAAEEEPGIFGAVSALVLLAAIAWSLRGLVRRKRGKSACCSS